MISISEMVETLSSLPAPVMLSGAAAFAFAESGLGVGMFLPGETAVVLLGAAMAHSPALIPLFVVVAVAASAGDHVGYLLGRHYGERLRDTRLVARIGQEHWDRATVALNRWGAWAVFLTRLIPIVRTLTPALAGISGVTYWRFLPASLAGAVTWSATFTFAGALAGASISRIEPLIGRAGWLLGLVLVVVVAVVVLVRRRSRASAEPDSDESEVCQSPGNVQTS